jgi:hypothetical protein
MRNGNVEWRAVDVPGLVANDGDVKGARCGAARCAGAVEEAEIRLGTRTGGRKEGRRDDGVMLGRIAAIDGGLARDVTGLRLGRGGPRYAKPAGSTRADRAGTQAKRQHET